MMRGLVFCLTAAMVSTIWTAFRPGENPPISRPAEPAGAARPSDALASESLATRADQIPFPLGSEPEAAGRSPNSVLGLAVPAARVAVRSPVPEILAELLVAAGSRVQAGQVLARLDDTELLAEIQRQSTQIAVAQQRVREQQARMALCVHEVNVQLELVKRKASTESELITCQANLNMAQAKLASLEEQWRVEQQSKQIFECRLTKFRLRAPLSGTVTEVLRYPGQYLTQGDLLLWIDSGTTEVRVHLPGSEEPNGGLALLLDGRSHKLDVVHARSALNADGSRTVQLRVPDEVDLVPGQNVELEILRGVDSCRD